jgi:uncharacterized membrane protein YukC
MKIKDWINKHLKHEQDYVGDFGWRMVVHVPVGIICSIPVIGWGLLYLFAHYELNEDLHTTDQAWKDIYGAMVGFAAGLMAQIICLAIILI